MKALMTRLWRVDAPLTATGLLMLATLVVTVVGLWVDPRTIGGAPAWMKPAKFAISTAIFCLTLAWVFTYLEDWKRTRRIAGWTTAIVLVVEVAIIAVQAWRGTTSHFNVSTPADLTMWVAMGGGIMLQTAMSVAVASALWRQVFADRALGWALRFGLTISIIGAASAGFMTGPTRAQMREVRATGHMRVAGAHTVGAPDGGRGLPGVGWSRQHGDLRVPHFLGLHAFQALPLLALAMRRRWPESARVRLTVAAAGNYTALFAILLVQALRGQSVLNPDAVTLSMLGLWALLTTTTAWLAVARRDPAPMHALMY